MSEMSGSQYPGDVQFAGLIQAATAAADAQERNSSILGKRTRTQDDSVIDTQLRPRPIEPYPDGQLPPNTPILQSSASVLFREPSEKSKKYSRPPLGKVYTDLELAPESFLRLQNAAKNYMLDEDHPERKDVVGHKKHSSNNDVAKLRLWGCVEAFLNQDENGEKWFGHNASADVPDAPHRSFFWPEDRQRITKLCMPLFRKMVTNERQRIYAAETRKQDPTKADKGQNGGPATSQPDEASSMQMATDDPSIMDDSTLDGRHASPDVYPAGDHQLTLHINIVSNRDGIFQRVAPRFSVPSEAVSTLSKLMAEACKRYDIGEIEGVSSGEWFVPAVKIWLPDGLVRIRDDEQWMVALLSASVVEWMDSEARVLIDLAESVTAMHVDDTLAIPGQTDTADGKPM